MGREDKCKNTMGGKAARAVGKISVSYPSKVTTSAAACLL